MLEGIVGYMATVAGGMTVGVGIGRWWAARTSPLVEPSQPAAPAPMEATAPAASASVASDVADSLEAQRERTWEQLASDAIPLIPILTRQLEGVMAQNEVAAVKINEKILALASRTDAQARGLREVLEGVLARTTLDQLSSDVLRVATEQLAASSRTLATDVSDIVMALQYQDITKQQLQHVVEPLDQLKRSLEALVRGHGLQDAQAKNLLEALHKSYTMESERAVMAHALTGTAGAAPARSKPADTETAGDVTLF